MANVKLSISLPLSLLIAGGKKAGTDSPSEIVQKALEEYTKEQG